MIAKGKLEGHIPVSLSLPSRLEVIDSGVVRTVRSPKSMRMLVDCSYLG